MAYNSVNVCNPTGLVTKLIRISILLHWGIELVLYISGYRHVFFQITNKINLHKSF
jgi:hypothetical protein